tara:strand:+ start:183 stop:683 length:501 start_codon:yes stop_codon:yes gene_type:complete
MSLSSKLLNKINKVLEFNIHPVTKIFKDELSEFFSRGRFYQECFKHLIVQRFLNHLSNYKCLPGYECEFETELLDEEDYDDEYDSDDDEYYGSDENEDRVYFININTSIVGGIKKKDQIIGSINEYLEEFLKKMNKEYELQLDILDSEFDAYDCLFNITLTKRYTN